MGNWGELGGLILSNFEVKDFVTDHSYYDEVYLGQDFGFNHANAILEIAYKDGEVYILKELVCYEKDTIEIMEMAEGMFNKNLMMWCDSAEPDRIKMWKNGTYTKNGQYLSGYYRADGVVKEQGAGNKNSVNAQIDWLKAHKINIHPSCVHTQKEIQQWKWKKDIKTGLYIDEPVNINDDAMAALRYGIESLRKRNKSWIEL